MQHYPLPRAGQSTFRNEKDDNKEIRRAVLWFFLAGEGLIAIFGGLFFVPKLSRIMAPVLALTIIGLIAWTINKFWKWPHKDIALWACLMLFLGMAISGALAGGVIWVWLWINPEFLLLPVAVPAILSLLILAYCMAAEAFDRNGPTPPRRAVYHGGTIWPWTKIAPPPKQRGQMSMSMTARADDDGDYQSVTERDD